MDIWIDVLDAIAAFCRLFFGLVTATVIALALFGAYHLFAHSQ